MKRREWLRRFGVGTGGLALAPWLFGGLARAASGLDRTPSQTEGPFYPTAKPADSDNDLLRLGGGAATARGEPLDLSGRVQDRAGRPIADATVEIWQCDHRGIYRHPHAPDRDRFDASFQGYGETRTGADGGYRFLTIVPVPYTGRPPHIHVKVRAEGQRALTTQLYLKDHPENDGDWLLSRILHGDRGRLMIAPRPAAGATIAGLQEARFDFVL